MPPLRRLDICYTQSPIYTMSSLPFSLLLSRHVFLFFLSSEQMSNIQSAAPQRAPLPQATAPRPGLYAAVAAHDAAFRLPFRRAFIAPPLHTRHTQRKRRAVFRQHDTQAFALSALRHAPPID